MRSSWRDCLRKNRAEPENDKDKNLTSKISQKENYIDINTPPLNNPNFSPFITHLILCPNYHQIFNRVQKSKIRVIILEILCWPNNKVYFQYD